MQDDVAAKMDDTVSSLMKSTMSCKRHYDGDHPETDPELTQARKKLRTSMGSIIESATEVETALDQHGRITLSQPGQTLVEQASHQRDP